MIKGFRHAGLELFFTTGSPRKIQQKHTKRLRNILTALDLVTAPRQMDQPGYRFHELKGDRKGTYSVWVSGNWRVTFEWEWRQLQGTNEEFVGDAILTNYEDYH